MSKATFLARLADLGFIYSDDDFTNWARSGRLFARRNWSAVCAMIQIVANPTVQGCCTAAEALGFLALVELPFTQLHLIAPLFPSDEFAAALLTYLPLPQARESHLLDMRESGTYPHVPHHPYNYRDSPLIRSTVADARGSS